MKKKIQNLDFCVGRKSITKKFQISLACVTVACFGGSPSFANASAESSPIESGYCPIVHPEPGVVVKGTAPAPNGRWAITLEGPGWAGVSLVGPNTRSGTGVVAYQWYACSIVHPKEPSAADVVNVLKVILNEKTVGRGNPRSLTTPSPNFDALIKAEADKTEKIIRDQKNK